jgi:hypothetical protein
MNQSRITEDTKRILRGIREVNNMIAIPETRDNRMDEIKNKLDVILQTFQYLFLYKDELKNNPFFIKENLNLKKILGRINAIFITVKRKMHDIDIIKPQNKIQRYIAHLNAKPNVLNNAKPNVLNAKPNVLNAKPNVLNNAKPNGFFQTKKLKGSKNNTNLLNNPFITNGKPNVKRTRNNTNLPYNTSPIRPLFNRTKRYINHSKTFNSNKVTNTLSNNRMKEFNLFLEPSSDYKPLYLKIETLSDDSKTFIEITTKLIQRLGKATRPYQIKTVVMLVAILITKLNRILKIKEEIDLESVGITKNIDKEQIEEWKIKLNGDNTLDDLRLILVDILTKLTRPV